MNKLLKIILSVFVVIFFIHMVNAIASFVGISFIDYVNYMLFFVALIIFYAVLPNNTGDSLFK